MRVLLAVLAIFGLLALSEARAGFLHTLNNKFADELLFQNFTAKYGKTYASDAERSFRFNIFRENLRRAEALNAKNGEPAFGVTKFMDMDPAEFRATYLLDKLDRADLAQGSVLEVPQVSVPTSIDWTQHNPPVVTAIKNQEQCGSCWAFSATEQIESMWALAGNSLVSLAPQQIVDCDKTCDGCNGGWTYLAYQYVETAGGLEPETDYPYTGVNGKCTFNSADVAAKISAWQYISQSASGETAMYNYVGATAPLSVCVDASTWQYYNGGVLKTCGNDIDHCVQITGYNVMSGDNVWIVRNSWGTDWGVNGFIYVLRGSNLCAIADVATTVTAA
jgi:hypothetical protein